jgi:hypothetical protein
VRLQHSGEALYRDSLQVATLGSFLFGFRKINEFVEQFLDLPCTMQLRLGLGLADLAVAATIGAAPAATVSANGGWDY